MYNSKETIKFTQNQNGWEYQELEGATNVYEATLVTSASDIGYNKTYNGKQVVGYIFSTNNTAPLNCVHISNGFNSTSITAGEFIDNELDGITYFDISKLSFGSYKLEVPYGLTATINNASLNYFHTAEENYYIFTKNSDSMTELQLEVTNNYNNSSSINLVLSSYSDGTINYPYVISRANEYSLTVNPNQTTYFKFDKLNGTCYYNSSLVQNGTTFSLVSNNEGEINFVVTGEENLGTSSNKYIIYDSGVYSNFTTTNNEFYLDISNLKDVSYKLVVSEGVVVTKNSTTITDGTQVGSFVGGSLEPLVFTSNSQSLGQVIITLEESTTENGYQDNKYKIYENISKNYKLTRKVYTSFENPNVFYLNENEKINNIFTVDSSGDFKQVDSKQKKYYLGNSGATSTSTGSTKYSKWTFNFSDGRATIKTGSFSFILTTDYYLKLTNAQDSKLTTTSITFGDGIPSDATRFYVYRVTYVNRIAEKGMVATNPVDLTGTPLYSNQYVIMDSGEDTAKSVRIGENNVNVPVYQIASLESLDLNDGKGSTVTSLNHRILLAEGVNSANSTIREFDIFGEFDLSTTKGVIKTQLGTTGGEFYIPAGMVAFEIQQLGADGTATIKVVFSVKQNTLNNCCLGLWSIARGTKDNSNFIYSGDKFDFDINNPNVDQILIPTSMRTLPSSSYDYVYKMVYEDETGNKTYGYSSFGGDSVLVYKEFKVTETGAYFLGTTNCEPLSLSYFSVTGVASAGEDGSAGTCLGTVDFIYNNENSLITVDKVSDSSTDNYNFYVPSTSLIYFDNTLVENAGDENHILIQNEYNIFINRYIENNDRFLDFTIGNATSQGVTDGGTTLIAYSKIYSDKFVLKQGLNVVTTGTFLSKYGGLVQLDLSKLTNKGGNISKYSIMVADSSGHYVDVGNVSLGNYAGITGSKSISQKVYKLVIDPTNANYKELDELLLTINVPTGYYLYIF